MPLAISDQSIIAIFMAVAMLLFMAIVLAILLPMISAWMRLAANGTPVTMMSFLGMRLRRTPIRMITDAYVELLHRGRGATLVDIERAYLANRSRIRNARDLIDFVDEQAAKS